jgi:hypothetical protein
MFSLTVAPLTTLSTTVAPAKSVAFLNSGTATNATSDAVVTAVATASADTVATIPVRTVQRLRVVLQQNL